MRILPVQASERSALVELLWPDGTDPRLRDQAGRLIDANDLAGKIVVLGFIRTGCAIECVARLMDLAQVARDVPDAVRSRLRVVVVSTDPARDDPDTLRRFVDGLGADLSAVSVLGSSEVATMRRARLLRYPEADLPEPPATTLLFDAAGEPAMAYAGQLDVTRLIREVATLSRLSGTPG